MRPRDLEHEETAIVLGIVAVVALVAFTQRTAIVTRVMNAGLDARLGTDIIDSFDDGLHLALCGAGGPLPAPNASGPCLAVVAGDQLFIVDVGTDSPRNLGRMGYQSGA